MPARAPAAARTRRRVFAGAALIAAGVGACAIYRKLPQTLAAYDGRSPPRALAADAPRLPPGAIALVLGGGGPRGFGHVGALVALEQLGIVPDLIVGSSIGALVGALLASGRGATGIRELALELSAWDIADLNLAPGASFRGDRFEEFISEAVAGKSIEQLPTRFIAVATRLPTGERTEFASGDVAAALRASTATPGLFPPFEIDGVFYADGDLSAPLPVLTATRLGAQHVIALDVSADLSGTPSLRDIPIEWVERDIYRRALIDREARHASHYIRVRLPYYAGFGTQYRELAIERGAQAIERARDELLALKAR